MLRKIISVAKNGSHIGTLREKPLHASLKRWYWRPGDNVEYAVDGYVIDLVRDDLLIEIQTRGFASMKKKVKTLLALGHHVRIVYPIPVDKWIVKLADDDSVLSRRRSPKHGSPVDTFSELVSFPDLVSHPRLEIEVLLITEEEHRRHTPGSSWRRRGWTVEERRLVDVLDTLMISDVEDLAALLPDLLPDPFTTAELASRLGCSRRTAQQMAYCLRIADVISAVGKVGNAVEYRTRRRHPGLAARN